MILLKLREWQKGCDQVVFVLARQQMTESMFAVGATERRDDSVLRRQKKRRNKSKGNKSRQEDRTGKSSAGRRDWHQQRRTRLKMAVPAVTSW